MVSTSPWTRTWSSRDDPRTATIGVPQAMVPAQLPRPPGQGVGDEAVLDDQQAGLVPEQTLRLVEDGRGEAGGPGAQRALDPQLGSTGAIGRLGGHRCRRPCSDAAGLAQGEDGLGLPAAGPAVAGGQATRVLDAGPLRPRRSSPATLDRRFPSGRVGGRLGQRRDLGVGQGAQRRRRHGEDGVLGAGRRPDDAGSGRGPGP